MRLAASGSNPLTQDSRLMTPNSCFLTYGQSRIHYLQYGTGPCVIVALHGYGESAGSFSFLHPHLSLQYCVIAIDLPYHGSTLWREASFTCKDMICIIDEILNNNNRRGFNFILIGYSMGGRVALSITENLPFRITRLILLAPDGMTVNFWYRLATQTSLGKKLFRFTMTNPTWFFTLLRVANYTNLVNKSIFKFVLHHVHDEQVRTDLYHRWTCLSSIRPDLEKIRPVIKDRELPVQLLYGKHDRMILPEKARHFCRGLHPYCRLHIIDAGHNVLQPKFATMIVSLLTA